MTQPIGGCMQATEGLERAATDAVRALGADDAVVVAEIAQRSAVAAIQESRPYGVLALALVADFVYGLDDWTITRDVGAATWHIVRGLESLDPPCGHAWGRNLRAAGLSQPTAIRQALWAMGVLAEAFAAAD